MAPLLGLNEPLSCLTHLIGALAVLAGAGRLLRRGGGGGGRTLSLGIFLVTALLVLALSAGYHSQAAGATRELLRRLDHAAIFTLIAGTFTPIHALLFRGAWRWGMLTLIWTLAAIGIALKLAYFELIPEWLGVGFYLGMGWTGLASGYHIARLHGPVFIRPLLWGALAYTAGAMIDFVRLPFPAPAILRSHEVFHFFVLAGLAWHWRFIGQIADLTRLAETAQPKHVHTHLVPMNHE